MYLCSPTLNQISLKKSFGKVVFQIMAKIKMTIKIKIGYFAAILKRYHIFTFFCRIVNFYSLYTYSANFIAKFLWESGFLRLGP